MWPMPGSTAQTLDEQDGGIGKVGYEINFNRVFFQYQPPRPLQEIDAELAGVEQADSGVAAGGDGVSYSLESTSPKGWETIPLTLCLRVESNRSLLTNLMKDDDLTFSAPWIG